MGPTAPLRMATSANCELPDMNSKLPRHDIVLIGAGHTNAHVLRMWRMSAIGDTRLTCITDFPSATYSGMLPGTLAGLYPPDSDAD